MNNPLAGARVDREAGVIRDVVLCGFESANGRDYPANVLREAVKKYEGRPVNYDHAREGTVARRGGWVANVRAGADGRPRGDIHLLKSHPYYAPVMEAAERRPDLFGMSHVAMCRTSSKGGREAVEAIERVESIDIVADPATNPGGFFEDKTVAFTRKQLVEWLAKHPKATTETILKVKRLGEMDDMGGMDAPAMDAPPGADADPDDAVMAAFKAAISDVVDKAMSGEMDPKEALSKIKKLLASHGELNNDGTPDTDGNPDTGGGKDGDDATPEGKRSKGGAILEALDVCEAAGVTLSRTDLEIVAATPKDRRKTVAERLSKAADGTSGQRPTGTSRRPGAGSAGHTAVKTEGKSGTTAPAKIPKFDDV
ncbi:MAG TPA: hypothetical protein VGE74_28190 [Gemmata sp.]